MITTQQIENTNAFKELDSVTKLIYKKKEMMDRVKREFEIAKYKGIDIYIEIYHPRPYIQKAIIELLEL